jgi:hypothetical protein
MIPVAFEGLGFSTNVGHTWSITVDRMLRFKPRTIASFINTTLITTTPTSGFFAAGVAYTAGLAQIQAWHYHFNDISNMQYIQYVQRLHFERVWTPALSMQYGFQQGTGKELLGIVNTHVFGAQIGAVSPNLEVALGYDEVPSVSGSYKSGAFVSPYTAGITGDPLYTTPIGGGLIDKQSWGQAYKATATVYTFNRQLRAIVSQTRLNLATSRLVPKNNLDETDLDVTVALNKQAFNATAPRGLTLRNRFVYYNQTVKPYSGGQNRFIVEYNW